MVNVKPLAAIAEKYGRRAAAAQGDYQTGVQQTPPAKWEAGTRGGADNWQAGVQQAAARGAFAAGVDGKGAKWQDKATKVGPARYAQGVSAAQPYFMSGFQRYFDALSSLTLGPKGPRGDQRNYARSAMVGDTLHKLRIGAGR